jgi:hypothetical protein
LVDEYDGILKKPVAKAMLCYLVADVCSSMMVVADGGLILLEGPSMTFLEAALREPYVSECLKEATGPVSTDYGVSDAGNKQQGKTRVDCLPETMVVHGSVNFLSICEAHL